MTDGNFAVGGPGAEFRTAKRDRNVKIGSGDWIRTNDLRVISLNQLKPPKPSLNKVTFCSTVLKIRSQRKRALKRGSLSFLHWIHYLHSDIHPEG